MVEESRQEVTREVIGEKLENVKEALQLENIQSNAIDPLLAQWVELIDFLPKLIAAAVVLLIGLLVAFILGKITASLLRRMGIDRLGRSAGVNEIMTERGLKSTPSKLIGKMVFWLVAFTAFIPATELLGVTELVRLTQQLVLFLPKIIIALMIMMLGMVVASSLRKSVRNSKSRLGLTSTRAVGNLVYGLTAAVTVVVALGQLELDTRLLHTVLITLIASICSAIALAVGLGGRELAHNLIAGFYARESFQPGTRVTLGEYRGELLEVRAQNMILRLEDGSEVSIPNSLLFRDLVVYQPETE
ncbi:MAG: hypothetical protein CSA79_04625 [Thiothrix nivea]|nr:MAG: hypothetical protein CSA79_04625 [Thiothrix nivea]